MIVLDTNVISELMRPAPDEAVFAFVDAQPRAALYTTTIVQAEILAGVALLPEGRRRTALEQDAARLFRDEFAGRVLPFDHAAATQYAQIVAQRRATGRPLQGFDGLIAAIAAVTSATVATRNIADFEGCEVALVNPWDTS